METPSIFQSRKFWIMCWDVLVSLVLLIGGWYLAPAALDKITAVIAVLQAPVLFVIGAIAVQNVTALKAKADTEQAKTWADSDKPADAGKPQ